MHRRGSTAAKAGLLFCYIFKNMQRRIINGEAHNVSKSVSKQQSGALMNIGRALFLQQRLLLFVQAVKRFPDMPPT